MATTRYKFLSFFNKDGSDLNFTYDSETGIWTGNINIPTVSVGLYEVASIFILEEFLTIGNQKKFGVPHFSDPSSINTDGAKWIARWEDDNTKDIILFQFNTTIENPTIEVLETLEIPVDYDIAQTADINTGQIITSKIKNTGIQLNIALNSEVEDIFERTLIIEESDTGVVIAKVNFYGETLAEDDRFVTELVRYGMDIDQDEYSIFRDSDVEESMPDFTLLNAKRKEMLLEGKNIHPFKGTYKGLINAIKFYGYNNIKIREHWLNIDRHSTNYGKYRYTDVLDIFDTTVDLNDKTIDLPNKIFKKTNLFSLVYRLNTITNELNQDNLPIVEETSDFTFEEVLIKLFGLKKVLKDKYLPGISKIVDIVGEADYFGRTNMIAWSDIHHISKINSGIDPCFTISPSNSGYIQDLRSIEDIFFPSVTPFLLDPKLTLDSQIKASEIADVLLAYFTDYNPKLDTVAELPDKPGIPAGYPIVLENCSFDITWDDAEINWDELIGTGSLVYDFKPINKNTGDTYIIKDRISGEFVSYIVQSGDSYEDIVNGLYNQIITAANTDDGRPWSYYAISKQDKDGDTVNDTVRLKQIFAANIGVELVGETIDGGLLGNNPSIDAQLVTGNSVNTWNTFGIGNFYEIEWIIRKQLDDTPAFYFQVRGDIGEFNKLAIALPYTGFYDVELRLYDTFNQSSSKIMTDYIEVLSKNVEVVGFYKFREKEYTWNAESLKGVDWNFYSSDWDLPIVPSSITYEGHASLYESLDRANYILNNTNPDQRLSYHFTNPEAPILNVLYTPGPYFWDNLGGATWNDAYHLWWASTKVSGDTPANFRIYSVVVNSELTIQQQYPFEMIGNHVFTTADLELAADELNASTDPVISKYIYNKVYDIATGDDTFIVFIQAVAKHFGKNGDWVDLSWTSDIDLRYEQLHDTNNPTYNDVRFLDDGKILPKLVHLTFTYDRSKIPGKQNPRWHLTNIDSIETDDIYFTGRWFTYMFKRSGRYNIELLLDDSNGNEQKLSKNVIIIK